MKKPELDRRFSGLQKAMKEAAIGVCAYACCPVYQYLTCLPPDWRNGRDLISSDEMLIVPQSGMPSLVTNNQTLVNGSAGDLAHAVDVRSPRELPGILSSALASAEGDIGVGRELKGDMWLQVLNASDGRRVVPGWHLLDPVRAIKDGYEIEILRRAATLTDEAVDRSLSEVKEGTTMRELQLAIEMHGRDLGATSVSFSPVSGFIKDQGRQTGSIFSYEPSEGLEKDTTIFFDIGFVVDGYCSDWGRSVFFGKPPQEISDAYDALNHSVIAAAGKIEPGITRPSDVFDLIEADLDLLGFADLLRARLPSRSVGHQIGVEVHENPWLQPGSDGVLTSGMVMCFEPKLWSDGRFYLRVEDMILVNSDGAEILSHFDRTLFSI